LAARVARMLDLLEILDSFLKKKVAIQKALNCACCFVASPAQGVLAE
jgi:hypothetical protein